MLLDHVAVEARTLLYAEHAGDAAHDSSDRAADECADRSPCPFTFAGTAFHAARHALRHGGHGPHKRDRYCGSSNDTTDHKTSLRS
jgi:hypothetical protein